MEKLIKTRGRMATVNSCPSQNDTRAKLCQTKKKENNFLHNFLHDHRTQVAKLAAKAVQAWKSAKGITNIFKLKESRLLFGWRF